MRGAPVRRRATVAVAALLGCALAALVVPPRADAQTSPTITPSQDTAATPPANWSIRVQDSGWGRSNVSISFAGQQMAVVTPTNGVVDVVITPAKRVAGEYAVVLNGNPCAPFSSCPTSRGVGFRSIPTSSHNNPCGPVGSTVSLTVTGAHFPPQSFGYVTYDPEGPDQQARYRIPTGAGTFSATFSVVIRSRAIPIHVNDVDGNTAPILTWRAAPCPTTTTSTSTSITTTTTTTTPPGDDPVPEDTTTTTTSTPADAPGTPVTIPPTVELPPPTAGATLTVAPELGPAGFVTGAVGTGFPPGAVTLQWSPGIGTTTAIVGPDGTFSARVLVLPNDRLGPRALIAIGGATTAYDAFLVVPSSVQPSGQDVQQITRIRRFNQR